MWMLVLVLGLGGIAVAVLAWYLQWRKAKRVEHERLWQQHHDWQEHSQRDVRKGTAEVP